MNSLEYELKECGDEILDGCDDRHEVSKYESLEVWKSGSVSAVVGSLGTDYSNSENIRLRTDSTINHRFGDGRICRFPSGL